MKVNLHPLWWRGWELGLEDDSVNNVLSAQVWVSKERSPIPTQSQDSACASQIQLNTEWSNLGIKIVCMLSTFPCFTSLYTIWYNSAILSKHICIIYFKQSGDDLYHVGECIQIWKYYWHSYRKPGYIWLVSSVGIGKWIPTDSKGQLNTHIIICSFYI